MLYAKIGVRVLAAIRSSRRRLSSVVFCSAVIATVAPIASFPAAATAQSLPPAAPTGLTATAGDQQVTLSWDDPGDSSITVYRYRQSTDGGRSFTDHSIAGSGASTTSYTVTGLTNDTAYTFEIQASNSAGWSRASADVIATPLPPPNAPTGLTATAGDQRVTLDWDDPGDSSITVYRYWQSTDGGRSFTDHSIAGSGASTTSYTVTGLDNGTAYTFEIQASNSAGWSGSSGQVSATPLPPPTGLTATSGHEQVTLDWDDPGDSSITGYRYRQSTDGGRSFTDHAIAGSGASTTSHTVMGLTNGTAYTFEIQAHSAGWGPSSGQATATPGSSNMGAPTGLTASEGNTQVTLEWDDPGDSSITGYRYRQSIDGGATFEEFINIAGSGASTTSHTVTGLTNGTAYTFEIQARDFAGWGPSSDEVTATPRAALPVAPSGLTATAGDQRVTLDWDDPNDSSITDYLYRLSIDGGNTFIDEASAGSGASTTSHTVTGLDNGTTYTFEILARNSLGLSPPSDRVTATPLPPPRPPQGLMATAGDQRVTLSWTNPNDSSITLYRYRLNIDGGDTFTDHAIEGSGASTTTHTVMGLANGTAYTFEVQARNSAGWSGSSDEVTATPLPPLPDAPAGLAATPGDERVTLEWDDPSDSSITGYRYRLSIDGGNTFTDHAIAGSGASTVSHTVMGLTNGTAYTFEVQARNIAGWSGSSGQVTATPLPPPDAPAALAVTAGDRRVTLDWADPSDSSITGYRYRLSIDGGNTFTDHAIGASGASTVSHVVTGLTNGTAYTFEVQARNIAGWSGSSGQVTATPLPPPDAPGGLAVTAGDERVTLEWDDPSDSSITGYRYRLSIDGGDTFTDHAIAGSGASTVSHTVMGLTNGTAYTFEVQARNIAGWSGSSGQVTATPLRPPDAPGGLAVTAGDRQVTLDWDDPSDSSITGYRYRLSIDGGNTFTDHAIAGSGASTVSHVVTGLTNGTAYTFEVQARNIAGWSGSSGQVTATPLPPPDAPGGLAVTAGDKRVTLDWADPSDSSITGYRYRLSIDGGNTFTDHAIEGSGASTVSHTVMGLTNGTEYTFEVQARNSAGWSGSSGQVTATPLPPPDAPAALAAAAGNQQVTLEWTDPDDSTITSYRYRTSTDGGSTYGGFTIIAGSGSSTTAHTVTELTNGTTFTFRLQASNSAGWSQSSNAATATPLLPRPDAPTGLTAVAGDQQVTLNWANPNDATITSYRYRTSTDGGTNFGIPTTIAGSSAATVSHTVTGLTNGTTYTFNIQAENAAGWSQSSNAATATPLPPRPDAPTGLTAAARDERVTLHWTNPNDATITSYRYRTSTDGGTNFASPTTIAGSSAATVSHTVTGLTNGTTYTFNIQAENAAGWSQSSNAATVTPRLPPAGAPTGLTATAGDQQVTLNWANPNDSTITSYRYRTSTDGGANFGGFTTIAGSGAATVSHIVTGLTNGTAYTFEIQARTTGWSQSSNGATATPLPPPVAPAGLSAAAGDRRVTLHWTDPDNSSITSYRYRTSTDGGANFGGFTTIVGSGASTVSHTVMELTNGTTYTFKIQAENTAGWSQSSNGATATPRPPPAPPAGLTAVAGNQQVTLNWANPNDATITAYRYRQRTGTLATFTDHTMTGSDAATTTHTVTDLDNGTGYTFKVEAGNAVGWSQSSNAATATPLPPPAPPADLRAVAGNRQVTLRWANPNDATITAYRYRQSIDAGENFGEFETVGGSGASTVSHTVTGLDNRTAYTFEIQARNAAGWSESSNDATATPSPEVAESRLAPPATAVSGPSAADDEGADDEDRDETPEESVSAAAFIDSRWFDDHYGAINALASQGVLDGTLCGPAGFCHNEPILRWVMAVWLVRLLDGGDPGGGDDGGAHDLRFADVDGTQWWASHVERLAQLGVTIGCTPDRYCPQDPVTRGQMASFLSRALGLDAPQSSGFEEASDSVHAASIDAVVAAGIAKECSPGRYCPREPVTRGQMASLLDHARNWLPADSADHRSDTGRFTLLVIPDDNLRAIVERAIGKEPGERIVRGDVQELTTLNAGYSQIQDLRGLEHFVGLRTLNLSHNRVSDLGPISTLAMLRTLSLDNNSLEDVTQLATLASLRTLSLANNEVVDATPLAGLEHLKRLYLYSNHLDSAEPLAALTDLETLDLAHSDVEDVSPLAALRGLRTLNLHNNLMADISPLASLGGLRTLNISHNRLDDAEPLASLRGLQTLMLDANPLTDISPLAVLTRLRALTLDETGVTDISPLAGLTALETLWLRNNQIEDYTPLCELRLVVQPSWGCGGEPDSERSQ